jgi:hypothetical protein
MRVFYVIYTSDHTYMKLFSTIEKAEEFRDRLEDSIWFESSIHDVELDTHIRIRIDNM